MPGQPDTVVRSASVGVDAHHRPQRPIDHHQSARGLDRHGCREHERVTTADDSPNAAILGVDGCTAGHNRPFAGVGVDAHHRPQRLYQPPPERPWPRPPRLQGARTRSPPPMIPPTQRSSASMAAQPDTTVPVTGVGVNLAPPPQAPSPARDRPPPKHQWLLLQWLEAR